MTTLAPYVLFDGSCEEAMDFYRSCLGGELTMTRVAETPMRERVDPAMRSAILHATLRAGAIVIRASDWLHPTRTRRPGNTVCLYLTGMGRAQFEKTHEALSAGARQDLTEPVTDMPFGAYGALTDRFGVRWMLSSADE